MHTRDPARWLMRHAVATVAYRGGKAVRGSTEQFAAFRAGATSRTPSEILAHIGDLFDWALWLVKGQYTWRDSTPLPWDLEIERFFQTLAAFDGYLASDAPLGFPAEKILQGPVADALTHIGQIAMLRRLGGVPLRGESYFRADVMVGRVGMNQAPPAREFD
jgi:hypothetical protein